MVYKYQYLREICLPKMKMMVIYIAIEETQPPFKQLNILIIGNK